jgi:hypothetical protein
MARLALSRATLPTAGEAHVVQSNRFESSQSESDRMQSEETNGDKRVVSRWEDTLRLLDATQVVCDRSFGIFSTKQQWPGGGVVKMPTAWRWLAAVVVPWPGRRQREAGRDERAGGSTGSWCLMRAATACAGATATAR